jgi:hypothetical protein
MLTFDLEEENNMKSDYKCRPADRQVDRQTDRQTGGPEGYNVRVCSSGITSIKNLVKINHVV